MENHIKFNMEQIMPIFAELKLANDITHDLITTFEDYLDLIKDKNNTKEYEEKILLQIKNSIEKKNFLKSLGSNYTTYEKLQNGLSYKYKINDKLLAENPFLITTNKFYISSQNSIIVNKSEFFIFTDNINSNIKNIQYIISELNLILIQICFYLTTIKNDVKHFNLFDIKYLDI
jgi:hypothetical protein